MKSESNWFISRQYIMNDKILTEHWNRDTQSWQGEKGGKGYTQRGGYIMHTKLFAQSKSLPYLSVTVKRD